MNACFRGMHHPSCQRAERVRFKQALIMTCRRKRVSPEASIDLEATSEGASGTSEEGAAVSGHPGDSNSEVQERSTSLEDPPKGPLSRRSGRKTKCANPPHACMHCAGCEAT